MSVWATLLETAIHSPSPHNVQPWRVSITNDREADLFIDSMRTLPKEDPTGSFIILTMGIFIEALSLLAARQHYRLEHELFHDPEWYATAILAAKEQVYLPFARLRLLDDDTKPAIEYDPAIFLKRRTSRLSLADKPVAGEVTDTLTKLAAEWDQRYAQITHAELIEQVLEQNTRALFHDLNNPDYHDEIVSWFRFTDRESIKHRDGLDYRCMNRTPGSKSSFGNRAVIHVARNLPSSPASFVSITIHDRATSAAPKIRYNLRDLGGVITHRELSQKLAESSINIGELCVRQSSFPILYVFGRGDLTVPFYGAKVYPTDIEDIVSGDPILVKQINSFQLISYEDQHLNRRLKIHLETVKDFQGELLSVDRLRDLFFAGLCDCNQDFREVAKMFDRSVVEIEVHAYETGPFHGRDIRVKNKYIG